MSTVRVGLYDADRRLVEQRGPFEVSTEAVPLDPPLDVPSGGMVLLAIEGRGRAVVYDGPMRVNAVKPLSPSPTSKYLLG